MGRLQSGPGSGLESFGILVFVFLCGIPALEINGFGVGLPLTLTTALMCATVGGAVGGFMICPKPAAAGVVGGLLAGPLGLLAVYFYTQNRQSVSTIELVIVQGLACLPGVGVGLVLNHVLSSKTPEAPHPSDQEDLP